MEQTWELKIMTTGSPSEVSMQLYKHQAPAYTKDRYNVKFTIQEAG